PKGGRKKFGSLILGRYLDGELVFCGHTGTGFSDKTLVELHKKMEPLIIPDSPFEKIPKTNEAATCIKPELIAEIKFTELTDDHIFRHPVFVRLREDINPKDLTFKEEPKAENDEVPDTVPIKKTAVKRENEQ